MNDSPNFSGPKETPATLALPPGAARDNAVAQQRTRNRKTARPQGKAGGPVKGRSGKGKKSDAKPEAQTASPPPETEKHPASPASGNRCAKKNGRKNRRQPERETQALIYAGPDFSSTIFTMLALPQGRPENKKKAKQAEKPKKEAAKKPSNRMFISILPGEQVEVAIEENKILLEYYLDMLHQSKLKGNIYKGIIQNIDVNLQAAFVDFGIGKNGFLQIAEIHPEYWNGLGDSSEQKKFPPIQKILKVGQEVLVQVVKEPAGNKGAFLTTWLSLAGRFLVLTPGQEQIGVSRKVSDPQERTRLREMMNGLDPGKGFGVIVRTVGDGATKTTLKNDLQYLKRLWREIRKKATDLPAPALLYQEPALSERSIRDYLTEDVGEIWIDDEKEAENVRAMATLLYPRKKKSHPCSY